LEAFQYFLTCTYEKEKPFVTPTAKQVSNDAYKILLEALPTLEWLKGSNQEEKIYS
jgi:hypothetical protein